MLYSSIIFDCADYTAITETVQSSTIHQWRPPQLQHREHKKQSIQVSFVLPSTRLIDPCQTEASLPFPLESGQCSPE